MFVWFTTIKKKHLRRGGRVNLEKKHFSAKSQRQSQFENTGWKIQIVHRVALENFTSLPLTQHSIAILEQSYTEPFETMSQQWCNNVTTPCCAKNRCRENVTSPLERAIFA